MGWSTASHTARGDAADFQCPLSSWSHVPHVQLTTHLPICHLDKRRSVGQLLGWHADALRCLAGVPASHCLLPAFVLLELRSSNKRSMAQSVGITLSSAEPRTWLCLSEGRPLRPR